MVRKKENEKGIAVIPSSPKDRWTTACFCFVDGGETRKLKFSFHKTPASDNPGERLYCMELTNICEVTYGERVEIAGMVSGCPS